MRCRLYTDLSSSCRCNRCVDCELDFLRPKVKSLEAELTALKEQVAGLVASSQKLLDFAENGGHKTGCRQENMLACSCGYWDARDEVGKGLAAYREGMKT